MLHGTCTWVLYMYVGVCDKWNVCCSLQNKYQEVDSKYKDAMVTNAQLYTDKTQLVYHVESLKDKWVQGEMYVCMYVHCNIVLIEAPCAYMYTCTVDALHLLMCCTCCCLLCIWYMYILCPSMPQQFKCTHHHQAIGGPGDAVTY